MNIYQSPLVSRAASKQMLEIWSQIYKFKLWRELWYNLAKSQSELGLPISNAQIEALKDAISINIDISKAERYEKDLHHDVMAHIKLLGDDAKKAKGIIHLGATSQFVVDNADSIRINRSTQAIIDSLKSLMIKIGKFAYEFRMTPTLGLTHLQPAQPTTVGKRAASWAYDLNIVYEQLVAKLINQKARGIKGATGTQASFLELFNGNIEKVEKLNRMICDYMNMESYIITGQTYPRIDDAILINILASIAAVCQKIATDIRLLASKKEIMEGFGAKQVGSSAMPYKRNPINCEKVCGLAKFLIGLTTTGLTTAAEQWLERSLDDSSVRRLIMPESFLTADGILQTMHKIFDNIVVCVGTIKRHLEEYNAKLITEKALMIATKNGADRQVVHEKIRQLALIYDNDDDDKLISEIKKINGLESISNNQASYGMAAKQTIDLYRQIIVPLMESTE